MHPCLRQASDPASQGRARQRMNVVEIDDAIAWHAVVGGGQSQLGHQSSTGAGQCCYDDRADPVGNRISRENENGPVTAGCRGEPQFTAPHRPSLPIPRQAPIRRSRRGISHHPSPVTRRTLAHLGLTSAPPGAGAVPPEEAQTGRCGADAAHCSTAAASLSATRKLSIVIQQSSTV